MRPEIQQGPRGKKGLIAMHRHINTLTYVLNGAHEEENTLSQLGSRHLSQNCNCITMISVYPSLPNSRHNQHGPCWNLRQIGLP